MGDKYKWVRPLNHFKAGMYGKQTWQISLKGLDDDTTVLDFDCYEGSKFAREFIKRVRFKNMQLLDFLGDSWDGMFFKDGSRHGKNCYETKKRGFIIDLSLPESAVIDLRQISDLKDTWTFYSNYSERTNANIHLFVSEKNELCCFDDKSGETKTILEGVDRYDYISSHCDVIRAPKEILKHDAKKQLFIDDYYSWVGSFDPENETLSLCGGEYRHPLSPNDTFDFKVHSFHTQLKHPDLKEDGYQRMLAQHFFVAIAQNKEGYELNVINRQDFQSATKVQFKTIQELIDTLNHTYPAQLTYLTETDNTFSGGVNVMCLYEGVKNGLDSYRIVNERAPDDEMAHHGVRFYLPQGTVPRTLSSTKSLLGRKIHKLDADEWKRAKDLIGDCVTIGCTNGDNSKIGFVTSDGLVSAVNKWKILSRYTSRIAITATKRAKSYLERHFDEYVKAKRVFNERAIDVNYTDMMDDADEREIFDNFNLN